MILEVRFNRHDTPFTDTFLKNNDFFVEFFLHQPMVQHFQMHDSDDDRVKGWYCNVGWPAVMEAGDLLSYVDPALDQWVAPDGTPTLLGEDKVAALDLDVQTCQQARVAVGEIPKFLVQK